MTKLNQLPFLGRAADSLQALIDTQTAIVFENEEIVVPVKSCSLVLALRDRGTASAADLAKELGCSHQLVSQKIPKLSKLKLIRTVPDPDDARRRNFTLTSRGIEQVQKLEETLPLFVAAYEDLFEEVGDTISAITLASSALEKDALIDRIQRLSS